MLSLAVALTKPDVLWEVMNFQLYAVEGLIPAGCGR